RRTNPWRRSRAPLPDAHISRFWIVGRLASRIGSPIGALATTCPVLTEFGAVASLGFACGPGSSYLDPISPRFAADFPPTAQTVGLGVFVARFFLCPKVGAIPTQPLVH